MPSENSPQSKPETPGHLRLRTNLFRIAGGLFALTGVVEAVDHKIALAVTFFSLCVVFIAAGETLAQKARQDSEASGGGSAKQPDAN